MNTTIKMIEAPAGTKAMGSNKEVFDEGISPSLGEILRFHGFVVRGQPHAGMGLIEVDGQRMLVAPDDYYELLTELRIHVEREAACSTGWQCPGCLRYNHKALDTCKGGCHRQNGRWIRPVDEAMESKRAEWAARAEAYWRGTAR